MYKKKFVARLCVLLRKYLIVLKVMKWSDDVGMWTKIDGRRGSQTKCKDLDEKAFLFCF